MTDALLSLMIDGVEYEVSADELELGDLELIEDELDCTLSDIDWSRAKALRVLAYVLVHRERPQFTMDDARKLKIGDLGEKVEAPSQDAPKVAAKRPTKAAVSG